MEDESKDTTRDEGTRSGQSSSSDSAGSKPSPTQEPHLRLPIVDVSIPLPPPDRAAFYAGLTALTIVELIDWPVALIVAAGHELAAHSRNRALQGAAESAESA